ncbi:MAG TPA: hypothetical protein VF170_06055, partial [Planctomycetaceae bacterium]
MSRHGASDAAAPEPPVIETPGGWDGLFDGPAKDALEAVLPGFLRSQRWFGGKALRIAAVRVTDWGPLSVAG